MSPEEMDEIQRRQFQVEKETELLEICLQINQGLLGLPTDKSDEERTRSLSNCKLALGRLEKSWKLHLLPDSLTFQPRWEAISQEYIPNYLINSITDGLKIEDVIHAASKPKHLWFMQKIDNVPRLLQVSTTSKDTTQMRFSFEKTLKFIEVLGPLAAVLLQYFPAPKK